MHHPQRIRTAACVAAALLIGAGEIAMAASLGGPLELQDEGSFFVNGRPAQSSHPGHLGVQRAATRHDHRQPDVCALPHPENRHRSAGCHGARLRPHRHDLRDDPRRAGRLGDVFRAQRFPGLRGRPFRPRPIGLRSDVDQPGPRRRSQRQGVARHPDRAARTRLVLLPHRQDVSDAVSGFAVSGRGVRPVHRATRAERRGDARAAAAPTPCRRSAHCSTRSGRRS